ncbi:ABC transporter permease [Pseudoalteromonas sp. T1lg22]|uniref:ABC transporter permease n=1 Tax=Pseudoalteromonas sp. T1lg22 TaxID=2077096 RepID=UPI000CF648A4|nr:ABC transporter permease [Pseudoalteromonas sp. T1lg22]
MLWYYVDLSWRSFKRTPLVSILMVIAIAIGIGITMTTLSVYHMMSADPIPSKSEQLFALQLQTMDEGEGWFTKDDIPYQLTFKDAQRLMTDAKGDAQAAMVRTGFAVHLGDESNAPKLMDARATGRDFFSMFNAQFIHGGPWSQSDEDNAVNKVVLERSLSEELFGETNPVGKTVFLDKFLFEVVGVIEPVTEHTKYYDLNNGSFRRAERVFYPFSLVKELEIGTWGNSNGWKREMVTTFKQRLDSEVVWIQYWVQLDSPEAKANYEQYLKGYIQEQQKIGRFARKEPKYSLRDVNQWMEYNEVVSEDNKILVLLSFMFLAVCLANILGLLLAKFMRRAPEVGVRRALGASKTQVFFQHLVEVGLLGLFGGLLGILLAQLCLWGVRESYSYYSALAKMDFLMLASAPIIAIVACILAGLLPAWQVCRTNPAYYLKTQ